MSSPHSHTTSVDTGSVAIRPARAVEAGVLGQLIADSFAHLPVSKWLVSDETERRAAMGGQFAMLVGHAIEHGGVDVITDDIDDAVPTAVAVWFPPGPMADIAGYDERLATAAGRHLTRFVALDDAMHQRHPVSPDHAYLALLAVAESVRDRGLGSALLRRHHTVLDADSTPAYLEASNRRSRELYLRHGYVDHSEPYGPGAVGDVAALDPQQGFWPMWRPAGG